MSLKDVISQDLNIFFNNMEFAEPHNINGRVLNIVVDNDQLMFRSKKEYDGISVGEILYYVSAVDYGKAPTIEEIQIFDNRPMQVFDFREVDGIYEIILKRNE
jgi:hypothetical protein